MYPRVGVFRHSGRSAHVADREGGHARKRRVWRLAGSPIGQHRLAVVREEIERPAAGARARRSPFDRFVEAAYQQVSRPPFFLICVAIVVAWLVSLPLWGDTKAWQVAIHTVASVLTLLLVALLENPGAPQRRGCAGEAQRHRRGARRPDGLTRPRGPHARGSGHPTARCGRARRAPLNQRRCQSRSGADGTAFKLSVGRFRSSRALEAEDGG